MLEQYFPVLLFILVGVGIGHADADRSARLVAPNRPDAGEAFALRVRLRGVRRRANEVRRPLLPRSRSCSSCSTWRSRSSFRGRSCSPDIGVFGFWSMMIFLAILIVGFVYEWKKGALEWE